MTALNNSFQFLIHFMRFMWWTLYSFNHQIGYNLILDIFKIKTQIQFNSKAFKLSKTVRSK